MCYKWILKGLIGLPQSGGIRKSNCNNRFWCGSGKFPLPDERGLRVAGR